MATSIIPHTLYNREMSLRAMTDYSQAPHINIGIEEMSSIFKLT